jgi:uncharacterized protein YbcI
MNLANKKDYPLVVLHEIRAIRSHVRQLAKDNQEFISYLEGDDYIFQLEDIDPNSNFHYKVFRTELAGSSSEILNMIEFTPKNRIDLNAFVSAHNSKDLFDSVNRWITNIKEYSNIHLTEIEQIDSAAEKEIYELFDFVDEDANTAAFDLKQQLYLDDALANVEATLEAKKGEYEVAEIIEEVKELRTALLNETKKTFGKKLSKLFVAIKKKGIPLFKEVVKDFFKDMMKKSIEGGFQRLIEFFQ